MDRREAGKAQKRDKIRQVIKQKRYNNFKRGNKKSWVINNEDMKNTDSIVELRETNAGQLPIKEKRPQNSRDEAPGIHDSGEKRVVNKVKHQLVEAITNFLANSIRVILKSSHKLGTVFHQCE